MKQYRETSPEASGGTLGHTGEGPGFTPSGTDTINITLMQGDSHRLQGKCRSPPGGFKVKNKNSTKDQNEDWGGGPQLVKYKELSSIPRTM